MKKILAVLMTMCLVLLMTGCCGGDAKKEAPKQTTKVSLGMLRLTSSAPLFIAMDKEGSYTPKAQKIMEDNKVLQLNADEGALFGRTWNDVEVENN